MMDPLRATLDRLGLGDFYNRLAANDVDANVIDELSEADLRELGLTLGQRKRFLRARSEAQTRLATPRPSGAAAVGAPSTGERRQLTSMFCDLVGSTPLSLRLDPEDFSEVIRSFQDACAGVITRGSGYVAQYLGDGVLAYFGYPRAREDDAQGAARAALEILSKIGQLRTPGGETLNVRVGIATGLVVVGDVAVGGTRSANSRSSATRSISRPGCRASQGLARSSFPKRREISVARCSITSGGATWRLRAFRNP